MGRDRGACCGRQVLGAGEGEGGTPGRTNSGGARGGGSRRMKGAVESQRRNPQRGKRAQALPPRRPSPDHPLSPGTPW